MRKRFRILSLILSACMMINLAPLTAFAAEESQAAVEVQISSDTENVESSEESSEAPSEEIVKENPSEESVSGSDTEVVDDKATESEDEEALTDEELENPEVELDEEKLLGESKLLKSNSLLETEETTSKYFEVVDGSLSLKVNKNELPKTITLAMMKEAGSYTKITSDLFAGSNVVSIEIPSAVSEFGTGTFKDCRNLATVKFENDSTNATAFPDKMFSGCAALRWSGSSEYFTVPNGITTIGENAFAGCTGLQGINFTNSLVTISDYAFNGCTTLRKFENLSETSLSTIGEYAFQNTLINDKVAFPKTLVTVKANAFSGCKNLGKIDFSNTAVTESTLVPRCFANSGITGIKLPASYKTIPAGLFEDCASLTDVTIGTDNANSGVKNISAYAFRNCPNLKSVTLKNSVELVENNAFVECSALKDIYIENQDTETNLSAIKLTADSFPSYAGLTIHSYSGTAEEWAGTHKADGVLYSTLFAGKDVAFNKQVNGNAVSAYPEKNVGLGQKVTISPRPTSGYYLVSLTRGAGKKFIDSTKLFVVESSDINKDQKIQVDAYYDKLSDLSNFEFVDMANSKAVALSGNEFEVTYDTANQIKQMGIKVDTENGETVYSNPWLWNFSSSDRGIVSVDADGKIKLLKKTPANKKVFVTATFKANSKLKLVLNIKVDQETAFGDITDVEIEKPYKFEVGVDDEAGMKYAQTSKAWLETALAKRETRDFAVKLIAVDNSETPKEIESNFRWVSGDTRIAKVKKAATDCNENVIQMCGVGETTITATSTVNTKKSISFIVRVVDKTPYVADQTITINAPATEIDSTDSINKGVEFTLIQAYGGAIAKGNIQVVKKVGAKYENIPDNPFVVEKSGNIVDDEQKMLIAVKPDTTFYKNNAAYTNLCLKLSVDGDYYYVDLPRVTIVNRKPTPSIAKTVGRINKFYTNEAKEQGEILVTIRTPYGYNFDTSYVPTLECDKGDTEENFTENFQVETTDSKDFTTLKITQKPKVLQQNSRKQIISSGFLCFKYKGYDEPCKLRVLVPLYDAAPSLALDKTSVTTHKYAIGQSYSVSLYDRTAKKNVDIDKTFSRVAYTTRSGDYFDDLDPKFDFENDKIVVALKEQAPERNCSAFIKVENSTWTRELVFQFNVYVSTARPQIAVTNGSQIDVNLATSTTNYIDFNVNSDFMDASKTVFDEFTSVGNAKVKENADKISVQYKNGKIVASLKDKDDRPAYGTYTFNSKYKVPYTGANTTAYESNITVRVKIYETKPVTSLRTTAFALNDYLVGVKDAAGNAEEIASIPYTLRNTAAGAENKVNNDSFVLTNITNSRQPVVYDSLKDAPIDVRLEDGNMNVYLKEVLEKNQTFKISNLTIDGVQTNDLTFTVRRINAEPTVTLRSNGKRINVLEADTAVTYTMYLTNFNGTVDASKFRLTRQNTSASTSAEWDSNTDDFHFMLTEQNGNSFKLVANPKYEGQIQNRRYIYKGAYTFGSGDTKKGSKAPAKTVESKEIQLDTTPIQTMPRVTLSKNTANVYIGNRAKAAKVVVTPATGSSAVISNVIWSKRMAANLTDAFTAPKYDTKTNTLSIKIKNAALLKKGQTYTLSYNIVCDGQLDGTIGTEFSVRVMVK